MGEQQSEAEGRTKLRVSEAKIGVGKRSVQGSRHVFKV